MIAFLAFLSWLVVFLKHAQISNDIKFTLEAIAKMQFTAELYSVPILWLQYLQNDRHPIHTILCWYKVG